MSREAIEKAAELGVVVDIQPAWLYLDTRTLAAQFGYDRLRYFQPLQEPLRRRACIAGGGSDHMQKIGSLRSINPYNPFLGMWVAITRTGQGLRRAAPPRGGPDAASRRSASTRSTTPACCSWRTEVGSLEAGKLADFVVIDRDLLTCPEDEIKDTPLSADLPRREARVRAEVIHGQVVAGGRPAMNGGSGSSSSPVNGAPSAWPLYFFSPVHRAWLTQPRHLWRGDRLPRPAVLPTQRSYDERNPHVPNAARVPGRVPRS